jgi:DME family drug/metabolite transporter
MTPILRDIPRETLRGYLFIVLAAFCWGGIGPVSRYAFAQGMEPLEVAFWRALFGWVVFGLHAVKMKQTRVARRDLPWVLAFGLWGVSLFYASYLLAIEQGGAALAAVLLYTAPLWVAILARIFLGEKLTPLKILCVLLGLGGVAAVALGQGNDQAADVSVGALGWGLLSGFLYGVYYIFGKRFLRSYATPTLFLYALPVGMLGLMPFIRVEFPGPRALLAVIFLAVISTFAAYSLNYAGLKRLESSRAATVATIEPVIAGAAAWVWWGETFTIWGYLGSGLILLGVVLLVSSSTKDGANLPRSR